MAKKADSNGLPSAIDAALWQWAEKQLGEGCTVDGFDMSKVKVKQTGAIYEGQGDWYHMQYIQHEMFNNENSLPVTWTYKESYSCNTTATWMLHKPVISSILPNCSIVLEYPGRVQDRNPIVCKFDNFNPEEPIKMFECKENYDVDSNMNVLPYSMLEACVQIKTCRLDHVPFKIDIIMSGPITVKGHKKRKKVDTTCSIYSALKVAPGVVALAADDSDTDGTVCLTLEGFCSGEVPVEVSSCIRDIQTLV